MKKILAFVILCCFMALTSCQRAENNVPFMGSYTPDKTFSFDHELYAVQTVDDDHMITVTVYNAAANEEIDSFSPTRAKDFWGVCWEKDTYNIWIQSADTGCACFEFQNGKWIGNGETDAPEYIISKYNKEYENSPELQEKMYKSPTE